MRKVLYLILCMHSLYAFEFTQSKIPLSSFGEVIYDIYKEKETACEATLSFIFDQEDEKGNYTITMTPEISSRFAFGDNKNEIDFDFVKVSDLSQVFLIENSSSVLRFNYIHTEEMQKEIVLTLPVQIQKEQFGLPGIYTLGVKVNVSKNGILLGEKVLPMEIRVQEQSEVMISENDSDPFKNTKFVQWNFGPIESQVTKDSFLSIRANYDFTIKIESKNLGKLVLAEREGPKSEIPFQLTLGSRYLDLCHGPYLLGAMNDFFLQTPLSISLFPDLKSNLAGAYQDILLLSIVSMN